MNTAELNPGDRVEVNRKGFVFSATLTRKLDDGSWRVRDSVPTSSYVRVPSRWIVKKLESGVAG